MNHQISSQSEHIYSFGIKLTYEKWCKKYESEINDLLQILINGLNEAEYKSEFMLENGMSEITPEILFDSFAHYVYTYSCKK